MKKTFNSYIKLAILPLLILSNIFFVSTTAYCIEIKKDENLNSESVSFNSYIKFAEYLEISYEDLQEKLVLVIEDKEYKLTPLDDIEKHKMFFKKIFSFCDEEYMKFYGTGERLSEEKAESDFQRRLHRMWGNKLPCNMTFVIELNGECAGLIGLGPLKMKGFDPEISYIIDQNYCGKGIGLRSVKLSVDFLQCLKDKGAYDFKCLKATVHPLNVGSYNWIFM